MPQIEHPHWNFTPLRPGDRARNSQVEKFFTSDVENRVTSVVREGIQNSLDVAVEDVVHVRICIGETPASSVAPYVDQLFDHLNADRVKQKLHEIPDRDEAVNFLTFEDFNTSGLGGDPEQWEPDDDSDNPFFNFFRGEGVTDKSGSKRGRHGVGKMVFTVASRARCMFAVTSTQDEPPLLMGTSTLTLHERSGKQYHPDGWFGKTKLIDDQYELVIPVRDTDDIRRFCDTFHLDRETLPGLSVVVPWLDQGFNRMELIRAVVDGFFWPIIQGGLTVEVRADGQTDKIDDKSIDDIALQIDEGDDIRANLSLARWANELSPSSIPASIPPDSKRRAQNWEPKLLPDDIMLALQSDLDDGKNVALKVPMKISPKKKANSESTWFHVYLVRDQSCDEGCVRFIREGLIIVGARPRRTPGYRALVVIEEGPLATFLGDAENPAHTEWIKDNVRGDYSAHASCIEFVVQSVPTILRYLSGQQKKADPTVLLDLFYVPSIEQPAGDAKVKRPKKKPGKESDPTKLKGIKSRPKRFQLQRRANGFVLGRGDVEAERPGLVDIKMAYGVRSGNPIKKYHPADFRLDKSPIDVDLDGANIIQMDENHLRIEVLEDDFRVQVTGFDTNRDLFIDTRVVDAEPENASTT